jgi:hypothetical protein
MSGEWKELLRMQIQSVQTAMTTPLALLQAKARYLP